MTERRRFPGLSPRAYEHPADRAALVALRKVPGFDLVVRKLFGTIGDRSLRLAFLASSVRVSERQFPDVHRVYVEACRTLDVDPMPELYVAQTPIVNAGAVGVDRPFIVINSGSLQLLSLEELQFVLGEEVGHVLSGHVLYKTMQRLLMRMTLLALSVPLGGAALYAISTALLEWDRKSELSADRAGLLVVQKPELAMRVQMKLAGGGQTEQMDMSEFLEQAREYEEGGSVLDGVVKLLNLLGRTHPFPVLRLAELQRWIDSGAYEAVLAGDYPRRDGEADASIYEELKTASSSYEEDLGRSRDPLAELVKGLGRSLQAAGDSVTSVFTRRRSDEEDEEAEPDED